MAAHRKPAAEKALTITVSMPVSLLDKVEKAAAFRHLPRSEMIRYALEMYLEMYDLKQMLAKDGDLHAN